MSSYEKVQQSPEVALEAIGFLLTEDFSLMSLAAVLEPLRRANQFSGRSLYRWQTLTADGRAVRASNGMLVTPDGAAKAELALDALILCGAECLRRECDPEQIRLLQDQARRGVHLGALGSGSWVLASAGLLQGYECCASWDCQADIRETFPSVSLTSQRFVLDREDAVADRHAVERQRQRLLDQAMHAASQQFFAGAFGGGPIGNRHDILLSAPLKSAFPCSEPDHYF